MKSQMEQDMFNSVVLDNGSSFLKAGFAGEGMPRVDMPMVIGRLKRTNNPSYSYVGFQALSNRPHLHLSCPILRGVITNPSELESIWDHVFAHQLRINPELYAFLISEFQHSVYHNRARMTEIAFERFKIPALFMMNQFTLALYSYGLTTGLSVDIGKQSTCIVPVIESEPYQQYGCQLSFGGRDVTNFLKKLLCDKGYELCHSNHYEAIRTLKETYCYVSQDYNKELRNYRRRSESCDKYSFSKRNGIKLEYECITAPEILFGLNTQFHPSISLPHQIHGVISQFEWSIQEQLYRNIALSGGGTLFSGLPERLEKELKMLSPLMPNIKVHASPSRKYAVWIGGSILGSLGSFKSMWVSRHSYEENGMRSICSSKS